MAPYGFIRLLHIMAVMAAGSVYHHVNASKTLIDPPEHILLGGIFLIKFRITGNILRKPGLRILCKADDLIPVSRIHFCNSSLGFSVEGAHKSNVHTVFKSHTHDCQPIVSGPSCDYHCSVF